MLSDNPLVEVANFVEENASRSRVAVVFDLDSTLFCVSTRTQAILRDLGRIPEFAARFPNESQILRDIKVLPTDWGIRSVLIRSNVQSGLEFFEDVRKFWRKHFFGNHFLKHDEIYPSATEYVTRLHDLGAFVLYLTGRNQGSMEEGTKEMLKHWGFPFFEDARLIMKPSDVQTDETFKAEVLKKLVHNYDHMWFFENEPVIIEHVRQMVPQVRVVFVDSTHSGRAVAPADLPKIGMSYVITPAPTGPKAKR